MDNQNQNPYGNNNYYGNNSNFNGYNQNNNNMNYNGYNQNFNNMNNNGYNQNFNNMNNNGYNQNYYNPGYSQPMAQQQFRTITIPDVVAKAFLFMFAALLITAFAAFTTDISTVISIVNSGLFYVIIIAEIAVVLISNHAIRKNNAILAGVMYVIYSYLTGMLMSVIFLAYTMTSIATVFLVTALIFAVMAVYGMITKKDLSSLGSLCFMGLMGIIIAGLVNMFLQNSVLDTVICCIGVLIFVGLTAYDVQKIKARAEVATNETTTTLALFGGFELYLDFVNLFLKLLSLFGRSRD